MLVSVQAYHGRGYGYVPLRNGGNVDRRMGTQQKLTTDSVACAGTKEFRLLSQVLILMLSVCTGLPGKEL